MNFHGFRTIFEYEKACRDCNMTTRRVPFCKISETGEERAFALITSLASKTPTCVATWHLFSADEKMEILDGIINGNDANYLGLLASHGWFLSVESA